jgi:hypothetical protein
MNSQTYYEVTYTKALYDVLKENFKHRTEQFLILSGASMYVLKDIWEFHCFKKMQDVLNQAKILHKKISRYGEGSIIRPETEKPYIVDKSKFVTIELSPRGFDSFMAVIKSLMPTAKFTIVTRQDSTISDDKYVDEHFEYYKMGFVEIFGMETKTSSDTVGLKDVLFFKNDLKNNFMFLNKDFYNEYRYHYNQQLWDETWTDDHKCLLKADLVEVPLES